MEDSHGRRWSARQAGLAAIAGALVGIALTPLMASVWAYDDEAPWSDAPRLERAVGPTLESWGLLDFGGEDVPYEVYGKAFFLVYALMIPAMQLARTRTTGDQAPGSLEFWSWRVMFGALLAAGAGDFVAYWGVSLPSLVGQAVSILGFFVEFFSMPVLLLASAVYGGAAFRFNALPRWACALLMAAPLSAIAATLLVTNYIPNAIVVPLSLTWSAIGAWLWMTDGSARNSNESDADRLSMSPPN